MEEKSQKVSLAWIHGFWRIHPIHDFRDFPAIFKFCVKIAYIGKSRKLCIGWIRQNPGVHPSDIFRDFSSKWQFKLKNDFFLGSLVFLRKINN